MAGLDASAKRNAAWIIAAQGATKLGDVLTNPKTVLTWMLSALGAPGVLLSALVPVRESGSMLPQLFVSDRVKRFRQRKRVFIAGAIGQAVAVAAMGAAALVLPASAAAVAVLLALAAFSLARAFCSISSKDVLGRTVPKGFRGRVGGIASTVSGVLSAGAVGLLYVFRESEAAAFLAWFVIGAAALWLLGAGFYAMVDEPGEEPDPAATRAGIRERLAMVRDDPLFRTFVVTRSLLLGSALASPLFVVLAQKGGGSMAPLAGFVIASGLAGVSSSFLWGRLADRSPAAAMAAGGFVAAVVGALAVGLAFWSPPWLASPLTWPVVFLLFNVGYQGARVGRKTWVVDSAEGDRRTDYVSASNTLIAIIILAVGALHSPLQAWSPLASLSVHTVLCGIGGIAALKMGAIRHGNP